MPQKVRGHGEGTIIQRPDGSWLAAISLGNDANGKRLRKYIRGKTKSEVTNELTKLQGQKLAGTLIDTGRMTVGDLLIKWLEESAPEKAGPTTVYRYRGLVEKHILPLIGTVKLSELKPLHVQMMLSSMTKNNAGAETRRYAFQVIRRAFNVAIRWDLLIRNPCHRIDAPKVVRRDISPLTVEQAKKLFTVAEGFRNGAIFVVAVTTGLRKGELLALHWEDVDLEKGLLSVKRSLEELNGTLRLKEPKSKSGKRMLKLSALAVSSLWDLKAKQMAEGLAACRIVFANRSGDFLRRSNFDQGIWKPCRLAAGIPETVVFHDLRHTSASILFKMGTHPKIVQAQLGHSKIGLTMDTYSHLMPGMEGQAAAHMDSVLGTKCG